MRTSNAPDFVTWFAHIVLTFLKGSPEMASFTSMVGEPCEMKMQIPRLCSLDSRCWNPVVGPRDLPL